MSISKLRDTHTGRQRKRGVGVKITSAKTTMWFFFASDTKKT